MVPEKQSFFLTLNDFISLLVSLHTHHMLGLGRVCFVQQDAAHQGRHSHTHHEGEEESGGDLQRGRPGFPQEERLRALHSRVSCCRCVCLWKLNVKCLTPGSVSLVRDTHIRVMYRPVPSHVSLCRHRSGLCTAPLQDDLSGGEVLLLPWGVVDEDAADACTAIAHFQSDNRYNSFTHELRFKHFSLFTYSFVENHLVRI